MEEPDTYYGSLEAAQYSRYEEHCEVPVVGVAHTAVDPRAVVIHLQNTVTTCNFKPL